MLVVRSVRPDELEPLLALYAQLHPTDPPLQPGPEPDRLWQRFLDEDDLYCLVCDLDGRVVASCVLAIIPNLTRGARPYGLIENVITDRRHRRLGLGTRVLAQALQTAWARGCYKVMLLTGSREEGTLRFYEQAGFRRDIKTGFIAYPPEHPE